ncbi:hypothetical protein B0J12DRAFT_724636 [Macrophomina phaseolina]|uniref:Zn(2)-C6 fungal-type domain-containing protein n=1 Tax=Macrophomina phaseolina TaxID=35725 RepID=A0ABQ8GR46_9PEZI|nr:hypothetical protein B0J12DRAFT_724636 [Macrophomina phaseolina]
MQQCDESKPECWPCRKHIMTCDFLTSAGSSSRPSSVISAKTAAPPSAADEAAPPTCPPVTFIAWSPGRTPTRRTARASPLAPGKPPSPSSDQHQPPPPVPRSSLQSLPPPDPDLLNLTDLSLLHHFTTATAPTLSPWSAELRAWWATEVPRLALSHPFVMRALLALAGLHLARTADPASAASRAHLARAIAQHQLALGTGRAMLRAASGGVTEETSAPLYVFAVATMVMSMGLPPTPPGGAAVLPFFEEGGGAPEWVHLMRGIKAIADPGRKWMVEQSGVGAALREELRPARLWRADGRSAAAPQGAVRVSGEPGRAAYELPLARLRELVATGGHGGDVCEREVCLRALDKLDQVFAAFFKYGEDLVTTRLIFSWFCEVDQEFLLQIGQRKSYALLVFSHYGVLLYWIDRTWWLEGWGARIITAVSSLLDNDSLEWLQWPLQEIGKTSAFEDEL